MPRAPVVSFINYKGGVGKTTLAVEIAAGIAAWDDVRVLICDLDPQTNATFYLMDAESEWAPWSERHGTLRNVFEAVLTDKPLPDVRDLIYTWRKDPEHKTTVNLLPSHVGLMQIDIRLATKYGAMNVSAVDIVRRALEPLREEYEVIICDCPPNLGLVTQNALFASDSYVIVTMPEYLSSLGIRTITTAVDTLSASLAETLARFGGTLAPPALRGIVFNRVRYVTGGTNPQRQVMGQVQRDYADVTFDSYVSQSDRIAIRPEANVPIVLSPMQVDSAYRTQVEAVAKEFIQKVL